MGVICCGGGTVHGNGIPLVMSGRVSGTSRSCIREEGGCFMSWESCMSAIRGRITSGLLDIS